MKEYKEPVITEEVVEIEDVIASSGNLGSSDDPAGATIVSDIWS